MPKIADKYFITDPWEIIERGFNPGYGRVSESVFSLANENTGVRGFFDEPYSGDTLRGSYINGVYELENLPRSYKGIVDKAHYMAPAADWLRTSISVDGEQLDLAKATFSAFERRLDMKSGTLTRQFIWHTKTGKDLKLTFIRFLDMTDLCRAYQRIIFEAQNFTGAAELTSSVSFNTYHEGRGVCCWGDSKAQALPDDRAIAMKAKTKTSGLEAFAGAVIDVPCGHSTITGEKSISAVMELELKQSQAVTFDKKAVIMYDGTGGQELWDNGVAQLRETAKITIDEALRKQREYWEDHWNASDITIGASDDTQKEAIAAEQQGIRFCNFQMTQTYTGGSIRHNIGAKGLTGEAYNGHAFWDTEACCLPFYLFTNPAAARSLLAFRHNTLPQAIERAKMLDCEGACYPIATLNGDEACNLWQHASLQFQPSTAVAYGIRHYVLLTDDYEFLWQYGAEMLLQISRFLVSRCGQNPHTGQYGFYGVMGPDEFQMMVNNNAYTNYMAKRTLEYTCRVLEDMKGTVPAKYDELAKKTDLKREEPENWQTVAGNMAMNVDGQGLIEQHDGYFNLPHIDIHSIPASEFPLYSHWSYDRIYRNDMIKQPDVLMFLYLYNSSFSQQALKINYDYYEPRTIHESSLSPSVHSILAAQLGYMDAAVEFFGFATRLDLDNYNRNTNEGLHTTSIAMAWINIVYGFAGMRSDGELLSFDPRLPRHWGRLCFSITYKNRIITVDISKNGTVFTLRHGEPVEVMLNGEQITVR